ncbi:gamma-glutamyltransferase [Geomicrobium sp. JCM 19038]|uniref:gamma-glutamyltransferase n=1 Tax=Geomicrobium sp. JCM 19038 TaxID=1460635 RepID=UPI0005AB28EF|nr:gamma-glutamyltransferase [Geomicrobium sp. JCM 19038]
MSSSRNQSLFVVCLLLIAVLLLFINSLDTDQERQATDYDALEVESQKKSPGFGVATDNPEATAIGMDILNQGGNAIDAAIAVSYSLGVLEPQASGIGGGGVMLVHPAGESPVAYDYREVAPDQEEIPDSRIGVPGFVLGMDTVHEEYGSWSMNRLLDPAIQLAGDGVEVSYSLHSHLQNAYNYIEPEAAEQFYPNERAIDVGDTLKQEDLQETLKLIQEEGPSAFYSGKIGDNIALHTNSIDRHDLANYNVDVVEPVQATFADFEVYAAPPPAGGTMLLHSLQMAEELSIDRWSDQSPEFMKWTGAITRKAYQDRVQMIGDPRFVDIPLNEILEEEYAEDLANDISLKAEDEEFPTDLEGGEKDGNTTHFVIVDQDGTMVSATNTLSSFFGSGKYVDGFFLNNQLDNFSVSATSPNRYEPNKRPISYISPTILAKDDYPIIGIGSSGGRRITSTLTQVLVRHLMFEQPIEEAIEENRSYYDLHNPTIQIEGRLSTSVSESLEEDGYTIDNSRNAVHFGAVQSLIVDYNENTIKGGADPRRYGEWDSRS